MIGENLYGLTAKDVAAAPVLQRVAHQFAAQALAVEVDADTADDFLDQDIAFVITGMTVRATPGAAQTVRTFIMQLLDQNGAVIHDLAVENNNPAIAAAINVGASWQGLWLAMPKERIRAAVLFNAGANNNAVLAGVHGHFIPRGNLQLR